MPLCLHGTLGAAYTLFKDKAFKTITCITKNGNKTLVKNEGSIIQAHVSMHPVMKALPNKIEICKLLNLTDINQINNELPLKISSVGSQKLLVPLISFASLSTLKLDFNLIAEWSMQNEVNGLYVYTKNSQNSMLDYYARGFNPKTGHNEDAATGVAAAALALSLRKSINVGQGVFINRSSEITI